MDEGTPPNDFLLNAGSVMGSSDTILVGLGVCTDLESWGTEG